MKTFFCCTFFEELLTLFYLIHMIKNKFTFFCQKIDNLKEQKFTQQCQEFLLLSLPSLSSFFSSSSLPNMGNALKLSLIHSKNLHCTSSLCCMLCYPSENNGEQKEYNHKISFPVKRYPIEIGLKSFTVQLHYESIDQGQ